MTCPTTACYNGLPLGEKTVVVGGRLRYFGDGWQISKRIGGRRYWRIPVMDGEFLCEETFGTIKGVAGGNLIVMGAEPAGTLAATEAAVAAIRRECPGRDPAVPRRDRALGVEGRQQVQGATCQHQHRLLPTLRGVVPAELPPDARCVYEIVIDGLSLEAVEQATAVGRPGRARRPGRHRRHRGQLRRQPRALITSACSMSWTATER